MTIQQVVGLAAAVAASITTVLVAAEATQAIPTVIILVATCISVGLGAATLYLGHPAQMIAALRSAGKLPKGG